MDGFYPLTKNIYIFEDSVNCGIIKDNNDVFIIDIGDGNCLPLLEQINVEDIKKALFTHHHVDNTSGCWKLNAINVPVDVPSLEVDMFNNVEKIFSDEKSQFKRYNQRPDLHSLRQNIIVDSIVTDGQILTDSNIKITAINTPGHTDGSMSYIIEGNNQKTVAFVGDLIYDYGRILNLYQLQKKHNDMWSDYHGFMGDMTNLIASLDKILSFNVDILIPSHGRIIYDPKKAIDELKENLYSCYNLYDKISSSNFWFEKESVSLSKNYINEEVVPLPDYILEPSEPTKIIISKDKSAFIIDCGIKDAYDQINNLVANGTIKSVDGIWVSHYHDDHVEYVNSLVRRYNCKVYCHIGFSDILENPIAYNLPCLYKEPIKIDYKIKNFEDIKFKEFTLTTCYFPGQTIYHAALLCINHLENESVFFIGDSFTPAGIDDYCSYNINPLTLSDGYFYCMDLLEKLNADYLVNQHLKGGFKFSNLSINKIKNNLMKRFEVYSKLLPDGDINYGLNNDWIKTYPYCQKVKKSRSFNIKISIINYTNSFDFYKLELRLPIGLTNKCYDFEMNIAPNDTRHVNFSFDVPDSVKKGIYLVGLAVFKNNRFLGEQAHAKIIVE